MSETESRVLKNRWLILINVVLAIFMSTLDGSIVNVALPVMSQKMHVSMGEIEWVVTSFLITIVATILIFGRLGDIIGKTKVFKIFHKSGEAKNEKMDGKGAILFAISMIALFAAIGQGQITGYNNPIIVAAFIVSIITFILFIFVEKKLKLPLLDLNIFKNSLFSISIICAFIAFVAISASNIILPFYFQYAKNLSPAVTGLLMMVSPIVLAVVAPFSGYLSDKIGSLILTLYGLIFTSLGFLLIATLNIKSSLIFLMVFL
ncbi:MFS transporter [Clostridium estertheticum]|uniref:MFS transporter n=1 Tax=Clostridium estertheticum TaxID=238834 RepID=A0A7Y3T0G4_9CLOT|nr:MFS transporter [Clostridium estertheticum]